MLRQRQALALIGGADRGAVELIGPGDQPLVDEAADNLAMVIRLLWEVIRANVANFTLENLLPASILSPPPQTFTSLQ